jgi:hypothetical protein
MTNSEILNNLNELTINTLTHLTPIKKVGGAAMLLRASDKTFDVYLGLSSGAIYAKMPNGDLFRGESKPLTKEEQANGDFLTSASESA